MVDRIVSSQTLSEITKVLRVASSRAIIRIAKIRKRATLIGGFFVPSERIGVFNVNEEHIKSMVERGIHGEDDGFTIIPDAVLEDGSLSPTEILLFCRISKMGKSWASNAWFASKMNKSETWVSKSINSLIKKGYVEHVGFTGRFRVIRAIKDLNSTSKVEQEFNGGLNKSSRQGRTRVQPESTDKNKEESSITNVIGETPEKYGNIDINEMFEYWKDTVGYEIYGRRQANRNACNNLIKKHTADGVRKLIQGVALAQSDKYAPQIADFEELQSKLSKLMAWGKKNTRKVTVY